MAFAWPGFFILLLFIIAVAAQDNNPASIVTEESLRSIDEKYTALTSDVDTQSAKLLKRMKRKEERLCRALAARDSAKVAQRVIRLTSQDGSRLMFQRSRWSTFYKP